MAKKAKPGFDEFYGGLWGDRWPALRTALLVDSDPEPVTEGLSQPYFMDRASVYPVRALNPSPDDRVLDMCAAPGGKSLLIARTLNEVGELVANDRSSARRDRLKRVLSGHLSAFVSSRITVTGHDAAKWGLYEREAFDKVLLDAPCSSERHVLHSPPHLAAWSPARTKHLAVQAFAMLAAALDAVKTNGIIVYSTCTVSHFENDGVLEKLEKKRRGRFHYENREWDLGEATERGWIILPDTDEGSGPMYFSVIRRLE